MVDINIRRWGLNNRLEMGIDKCEDTPTGGVVGKDNGVTRIVRFMDFGKMVESGGARIRDMEEGEHFEEGGLVVDVGKFIREETVSVRDRHLFIGLSKVIILFKDHSGTSP